MNKKLSVYLAIVPIFMVLIGCAQVGSVNPQDTVGKNAKTHQEHNNLASYYDNIAMEMDSGPKFAHHAEAIANTMEDVDRIFILTQRQIRHRARSTKCES